MPSVGILEYLPVIQATGISTGIKFLLRYAPFFEKSYVSLSIYGAIMFFTL